MDLEKMRSYVWGQTLLLTTEKKTKFRDGKHAAYKEMWEALGGDRVVATVNMDENASEESKEAVSKMIEIAHDKYSK